MEFEEAVVWVRGLALPHKYAVESHPSSYEGRAALFFVSPRFGVPDLVKISGAFKTTGRAFETAERLERCTPKAVPFITAEGFGPVLAKLCEVVLRAVGFESRFTFKSGQAPHEVRATVGPFGRRQGVLRLVRSGRRRPKPAGDARKHVSVLEALPAWKVVGFMEEVDARGPRGPKALTRGEADLSY